jgi:hypothetical protein
MILVSTSKQSIVHHVVPHGLLDSEDDSRHDNLKSRPCNCSKWTLLLELGSDSLDVLCVSVCYYADPDNVTVSVQCRSMLCTNMIKRAYKKTYASLCVCLVELATAICCYPFDCPIDCQQP